MPKRNSQRVQEIKIVVCTCARFLTCCCWQPAFCPQRPLRCGRASVWIRNTLRWDKATWELPFQHFSLSPFSSSLNHCLQFPTFFSVTWATNQVPGFWAAARLEGFGPNGLFNTPQWINVNVCRNSPESTVSYWYSTAAQCGGYSQYYAQWDHSAYFDTCSSPCRSCSC